MTNRPPVALIGPGAIGCAVSGALVQAGQVPFVFGRTPFTSLELTIPEGVVSAQLRCETNVGAAANVGGVDAVLLCVKAHQTNDARPWLAALVDDHTTLFVLQNGVEHVERLRPLVGEGPRIEPVVVALPAERSAPGVCQVTARGRLTVPAGDGAELLATLLGGSFIDVRRSDDWSSVAWAKLVLNAALGGIAVLTRTANTVFVRDPAARELARRVMEEVVEVGRAEGAVLADDLPEQIIDRVMSATVSHKSSIVVDRIDGVATEWDARNAVVGRLGRRHGVATPLNDMVTTLIRAGEPAD